MIRTLCERLGMTPTEIIDAVNTKTKFTFFSSSKPLMIKIKDTISSPELWYHSYRGEVFSGTSLKRIEITDSRCSIVAA